MSEYAITLDETASNSFKPFEFTNDKDKIIEVPIHFTHLNIEFVRFLKEHNLIVYTGMIFHIGPNTKYNIHIDVGVSENQFDVAKLNYVLNGKDSHMIWFKEKVGKTFQTYTDNLGDKIPKWLEDDVEEVYRTTIKQNKLTLINAGLPHTLVNPIEFRTSYSMFLSDIKTGKHVSFDDAKERLKNCLDRF